MVSLKALIKNKSETGMCMISQTRSGSATTYLQMQDDGKALYDLASLFRCMGYISKDDTTRLVRYVQQVRQQFKYRRFCVDEILWACRNHLKLDLMNCEMDSWLLIGAYVCTC